MAKTTNADLLLCFKEGEPYLYDKENKTYIELNLNPQESFEKCKKILIEKNYKIRPNMREIWQILALTIDGCDRFCNNFSIKTYNNPNCFETIFSRLVSDFLNTFFPLEEVDKQNQLRRDYEKKWSEIYKSGFCYAANRKAKENLMDRKAGKKVY